MDGVERGVGASLDGLGAGRPLRREDLVLRVFHPRALRFEKMGNLSEEQVRLARRWTRLRRLRPVIEAVSILSLGEAVLILGRG
jgi:hypothetical protein